MKRTGEGSGWKGVEVGESEAEFAGKERQAGCKYWGEMKEFRHERASLVD